MNQAMLTPGQVHLFYTRIGQLQHVRRAARVFLKQILARYTGRPADTIQFTENRYGKPKLICGFTDPPVCFNLSHSGHVAVCALTLTHDIGVDIEDMQRTIDLSIADRFFSNQEAQAIDRAAPSLKQSLFYRFWTLKEAYAKATGRGLAMGLDQFSFVLDSPEIQVVFHPPDENRSGQWQFFQFSPMPGYMAAVAVNKNSGPPLALSVHPWVWD